MWFLCQGKQRRLLKMGQSILRSSFGVHSHSSLNVTALFYIDLVQKLHSLLHKKSSN